MRYESEYNQWVTQGKPVPPPHLVKQMVIGEFQEKSKASCLVETGTFRGEMIEAQKGRFSTLYSIELGKDIHAKAVERFKNDTHVHLICGDSGVELPKLVGQINEPTVFWLDGHFSGGDTALGDLVSPILFELKPIILKMNNGSRFVILIDDAREFQGDNGYPSSEELKTFLDSEFNREFFFEIKDDIIRVHCL